MFKTKLFLLQSLALVLTCAVIFDTVTACNKPDACVASGVASEVGLKTHNEKREEKGISSLALSPELSSSAAQCALFYCTFEEAPSCPSKSPSVGENRLLLSSSGAPEEATATVSDAWTNFWEGYPIIALTTKGGLQEPILQNYAQVMWRDASLVGFAVCNCSSGRQSVVAHYDQAPDFILNNSECLETTTTTDGNPETTATEIESTTTTTTTTEAPTTTTTAAATTTQAPRTTTDDYKGYKNHLCTTTITETIPLLGKYRSEHGSVPAILEKSQKLTDSANACNDFYCTLTNHHTWEFPPSCPLANGAAESLKFDYYSGDGSDFNAVQQITDATDFWNTYQDKVWASKPYNNMVSNNFTKAGFSICICGASQITVVHYE